MKYVIIAIVLTMAGFGFYFIEYQPKSEISNIKQSPLFGIISPNFATRDYPTDPSMTVGMAVARLTKIDGTEEWRMVRAAELDKTPDVVCSEVNIKSGGKEKHKIMIQFLMNKKTKLIELGAFHIDGTPQTQFEAKSTIATGLVAKKATPM